ncbi:MAG: guanylate kinase [Chlorobi bacterium]|nr:guanylate kinase [Chlorobiota bacterium]
MTVTKRGKLLIFSAPSGSGKTTLVRYLMNEVAGLEFSISACSRKPRKGEKNGFDYYFLSADEFREKIGNNEFVEWEEVYQDHFYGTLNSEVERIRNKGNHLVFDVDVKGGLSIKEQFGEEALAIFVKPPSIDALKQRLLARKTESGESLQTRLKRVEFELGFENKFDALIINDDLETAKKQALSIVTEFINS